MERFKLSSFKHFSFKFVSWNWVWKALSLISFYGIWILTIRLLLLTFITYFMISDSNRFQDINDIFKSGEVYLLGAGAIFYVGLIYWMDPRHTLQRHEFISTPHIQKQFFPGLILGLSIASLFIFVLTLLGIYQSLGFLIQIKDLPFELIHIFIRIVVLGLLIYSEEYLFRYRLVNYLNGKLPEPFIVILISIAYCIIKFFQFNLSLLHLATLFGVSIALTYRVLGGESFSKGAGIWLGILLTFQPLLSLPIFGNNFTGVLLLKPTLGFRLVTGGGAGPLGSLIFQFLLILDMMRSIFKQRTLVFIKN